MRTKLKDVTIRMAENRSDLEALYRFRYSIYVEEMGKPMPGVNHLQRALHDASDDTATHLAAYSDGHIVGSLRIIWGADNLPEAYADWYSLADFHAIPRECMTFTGRMMVAASLRRGSTATALAVSAYQLGCQRGSRLDFIHTTHPLLGYFARLGYCRYRPEFIDPQLGPRTPMLLRLQDHAHLEQCRSPFLTVLPPHPDHGHTVPSPHSEIHHPARAMRP